LGFRLRNLVDAKCTAGAPEKRATRSARCEARDAKRVIIAPREARDAKSVMRSARCARTARCAPRDAKRKECSAQSSNSRLRCHDSKSEHRFFLDPGYCSISGRGFRIKGRMISGRGFRIKGRMIAGQGFRISTRASLVINFSLGVMFKCPGLGPTFSRPIAKTRLLDSRLSSSDYGRRFQDSGSRSISGLGFRIQVARQISGLGFMRFGS